jgi:hypothetical protein
MNSVNRMVKLPLRKSRSTGGRKKLCVGNNHSRCVKNKSLCGNYFIFIIVIVFLLQLSKLSLMLFLFFCLCFFLSPRTSIFCVVGSFLFFSWPLLFYSLHFYFILICFIYIDGIFPFLGCVPPPLTRSKNGSPDTFAVTKRTTSHSICSNKING